MKKFLASMLIMLLLVSCSNSTNNKNKAIQVVMDIENYGEVTIELYEDIAPKTVANFVKLVESGFYDGLTFHRIMDGFMVQGGDPEGSG